MSYLKAARRKNNENLCQASLRIGCSRQHLSRLEQGKALATPEQARAIREIYGVPVLEAAHFARFGDLHRDLGLSPFELEPVSQDPWRVAYACWGEKLRKAGLTLATFDWMSHFLSGESSHECYAWLQVAVAGAEPFLGNPHEWGFDAHPIIDRSGRLLAERQLAGLIYRDKDVDIILWPQVSMRIDARHAFRLDCLMLLRVGGKVYWFSGELDGGGHDSRKDAYRSEKLGMLEVRISGEEIRKGKMFALLRERALEQVRLEREPAVRPPVRFLAPGRGTGWRPQPPFGPR
jgi:transcriptional regulator with XRE-family HTH domain